MFNSCKSFHETKHSFELQKKITTNTSLYLLPITQRLKDIFSFYPRYILNSTSFTGGLKTLWTFALSLKKIKDPVLLKTTNYASRLSIL